MIRVLVVDDHPVVREGLIAVLEDEADFQVVGAAATADDAVALAARERPDVVLLDLELDGQDGVQALPRLTATPGEPRVLVFTAYDADERVFGALQAGAAGYLLKGAPTAEIARAIRAVAAGGSYLAPRVAAKVVAQVGRPRVPAGRLSAREREVLRLVAAGQSNKQIARTLRIAERTVKFHVTSLFQKLGADNRAQAVARAAEQGLL
ncbi:MAG TPA: response regulator transcription factor [Chloroflexota bacterium]|nr:response regulator transcription factor [Chloroflexota bacterium]